MHNYTLKAFVLLTVLLFAYQALYADFRISKIEQTSDRGCNGSIEIEVDENYDNYKIVWTGPTGFVPPQPEGKTSKINNLCDGVYTVNVINQFNRCADNTAIPLGRTVTVSSSFNETLTAEIEPACGVFRKHRYHYFHKGSISLNGYENLVDENHTIVYKWKNGNSGQFIDELIKGEYCVDVIYQSDEQESIIDTKCFTIEMVRDCDLLNRDAIALSVSDELDFNAVELNYYPNPFSDFIDISISNMLPTSNMKLVISDVTGKIIEEREIAQSEVANTFRFKTSDFVSGIYFISLETNDGEKNVKIVKL